MNPTPPVFINPLIQELYKHDLRIDHNLVREILALPRETLIEDLHRVLYDSFERFHYFSEKIEWQNETHEFPLHALFLITELRDEQSLHVILDLLRQGEEYLEFWFNDYLTEEFWETIFWLGMNNLDELVSFMQEPGIYSYAKTEIAVAVSQIALYYPERRNEVISWFRSLFLYFLANQENEDLINVEMIGLLVCSVMDFHGSELREEIIAIYENGLAWPGTAGKLSTVLKELEMIPFPDDYKREMYSIFSRYDDILNTWTAYNNKEDGEVKEEEEPDEPYSLPNIQFPSPSIKLNPKIGRNDPCPCGSGKKFKKCCMGVGS